MKKFKKINSIFSCENKADILAEFFYLISSLYSSEENYIKSNFYLKISSFLNPKFKFNLSLATVADIKNLSDLYLNNEYREI